MTHITCQTLLLPTTRSGPVEEGLLIFADDVLMAVIMRLEKSTRPDLPDLRGRWFVETGYGPCSVAPGSEILFLSPDEAQQWVLERVTRARGN